MRSQIQNAARPPSPWNIPVLNTTSETIPPHAVMQIVGASTVGTDTVYHVTRPLLGVSKFVINSPASIGPQSEGWATDFYPTEVAYDPTTGVPSTGAQWDVTIDSWVLTLPEMPTNRPKYIIMGGAAIGTPSLVRATPKVGDTADTDRLVAASENDPNPLTLIQKISTAAFPPTFTPSDHQLVWADHPGQELGMPDITLVRLYTNKGSGGPPPPDTDTDYRVSASPTDPPLNAKTLIEKISTAVPPFAFGEAFVAADHQLVYADNPTTGLVRFYTRKTPAAALPDTFICTLSSSISGGSVANRGQGLGSVYRCGSGSANISVGTHIVYNPFPSDMPSTAIGGGTIIYTCAKTFAGNNGIGDEYTILGTDPFYLLASRDGFGEKKALAVGAGGSTPDDIKWLGEECEETP
jgi:hypothetical protein